MPEVNSFNIFNEINTPLRFYDSISKRNENKSQCDQDCPYKLITPQHVMLPFMIVRDVQLEEVDTFKIITENGATTYDLDPELIERQTFLSKDYFIYKGQLHGLFLDCGYYYCEVADTYGRTYYSEKFYVMTSGYCGNIALNGDFKNDLSNWNVFGNVTWSAGSAVFGGGGLGANFNQYIGVNKKIRVTFTISDWAGTGTASIQIGGTTIQAITGNGTFSVIGNTESIGRVFFIEQSTRTFKLDNVEFATLSSDSMQCSVMFEWLSDCDFGNIFYGSGFTNRFYCPPDAPIGEPTYRIVREGTTNGNGDFIESFRKRQKVYKIEIGLVPEYIVDALMDMQLHPIKKVHLPDCAGYAIISDVNVSASWEFEGCYANVEITFSIDEMVETGCCGSLRHCVDACHTVKKGLPVDPCEDGVFYIDPPNGKIYVCRNGVLQETTCDSGYVAHDPLDLDEDEISCPSGWILEDGEYLEVPAILSITPDPSGVSMYIVKARLMIGSVAILSVNDVEQGVFMNNVDWATVGQSFFFDAGTTYVLTLRNITPNCSYGYSCPFETSLACLEPCDSVNQYKIPPYTIGQTYMLPDGTLGTATTVDGDFTLMACPSGIAIDLDSTLPYVYSPNALEWFPMPKIYSIVSGGGTINIKAAMPAGSTGELFDGGISTGITAPAADWDGVGVDFTVALSTDYDFTVKVTQGDCDYGESEVVEYSTGSCTFYQASGIDTSAHNPASVWKGITIDGVFYDFVSTHGSYPALTDNTDLQLAIEDTIIGFLSYAATAAVGYVAPNMYPNITTFNPSSFDVDSIRIEHPDTSTQDFTYTKSCS